MRQQSNVPVATLSDGADQFAEIYGSLQVNSNRYFVIGVLSLLVALASVATLVVLLPLKEVVPYVVEVNPGSGLVNKPIEVTKVSPNIAVVKA